MFNSCYVGFLHFIIFYYDLISLWTFTFSIAELLASSVQRLRSWKAQRDHPQRAKRSKKGCWFGMGCQIWPWVSVTQRQTAKKNETSKLSSHGISVNKAPELLIDYTGPFTKLFFIEVFQLGCWGQMGSGGFSIELVEKSTWPCQAPNFWRLIQQI